MSDRRGVRSIIVNERMNSSLLRLTKKLYLRFEIVVTLRGMTHSKEYCRAFNNYYFPHKVWQRLLAIFR